MKSAIAALAVMAVIGSQALAETAALPPAGKPAGVQAAQRVHHRFPLLMTLGIAAVVAAGVVYAVAQSNNGDCRTCNIATTTTG